MGWNIRSGQRVHWLDESCYIGRLVNRWQSKWGTTNEHRDWWRYFCPVKVPPRTYKSSLQFREKHPQTVTPAPPNAVVHIICLWKRFQKKIDSLISSPDNGHSALQTRCEADGLSTGALTDGPSTDVLATQSFVLNVLYWQYATKQPGFFTRCFNRTMTEWLTLNRSAVFM
jgi:hypothetical protein